MVSTPRRLSVFQGRDGLRKTEGTVCWEERERMRKRCMDRWVWSGSSQPWWRLMGGWEDKSWEGGSEGVFVRGGTCWKAGIIDGVQGEVNQEYADMTSMARVRNGGEQSENHRATVIIGKGKLEEGGDGDSEGFWGQHFVCWASRWVVIPRASTSTSLVHYSHLRPQKLGALSCSFHHVLNNNLPAITHSHTASWRINRIDGRERHKRSCVINGKALA